MIPKKIHYVWISKIKDQSTIDCIEGWKKTYPDYEIIEWNADNIDLSKSQFAREALEQKKYAFVTDYIRLKVLYEYGGIYLDTDVLGIKSFDDLLHNKSVIGFENLGYLESAVILSEPNQKWLKEAIYPYEHCPFIIDGKMDILPNTMRLTGFFCKKYGLKLKNEQQLLTNGLLVLPRDYFAPKEFTTGLIFQTENSYVIHNFKGSWFSNDSFSAKLLCGLRKVVGKKIFDWFIHIYGLAMKNTWYKKYLKLIKRYNGK